MFTGLHWELKQLTQQYHVNITDVCRVYSITLQQLTQQDYVTIKTFFHVYRITSQIEELKPPRSCKRFLCLQDHTRNWNTGANEILWAYKQFFCVCNITAQTEDSLCLQGYTAKWSIWDNKICKHERCFVYHELKHLTQQHL